MLQISRLYTIVIQFISSVHPCYLFEWHQLETLFAFKSSPPYPISRIPFRLSAVD